MTADNSTPPISVPPLPDEVTSVPELGDRSALVSKATVAESKHQEPEKNQGKGILILLAILLIILIAANVWFLLSNMNQSQTNEPNTTNNQMTTTPPPSLSATVEVPVDSTLVVAGRLRLTSPVSGQLLNAQGGELVIGGEMKDFFEATMNFRLVSPTGEAVVEDYVMATGDNYGQFAPFQKTITYPASNNVDLPAIFELVFYEVSMQDGSEKELITVPLHME